jgi:eukaryotic-like serine/threonine-protein kinase
MQDLRRPQTSKQVKDADSAVDASEPVTVPSLLKAIIGEPMPLEPGTKLGPYEVGEPLGAGGMGEVYRALDTRLDRTVAIKILPAHLSSDPVRRQRFEREAKTISSLNHPHICVLHDVGSQDGISYLVMECVEGETLAARLAKGPLPLDQVLTYGIQIADALDKADRGGVVHRDLKPGNIMLTASGVKLLDFGLAKPAAPLASLATMTASVPELSPVTEQGTIVGTFQYMSPEQIEGKELDCRSDIFSLGAVLFEMLTGARAFEGKSQLSVASAILEKDPPPIASLKPLTPPALDHAIATCLAKDRQERWQSARDLAIELKWISDSPTGASAQPVTPRKSREWLAWALAGVFAAALLALAIGVAKYWPSTPPVLRTSLLPPPGWSLLPYNFAISPDGSRVAFVAIGPNGKTSLWVRGLASFNAQQLTGTEAATFPFWSPDSLHIGFFAGSRLKTVDLLNSSVQILCETAPGFGGSWNQNGIILFASGIIGPLYRIPAAGGTPVAVTSVPQGSSESHHWPFFLPDGNHFLYFVDWAGPPGSQRNGLYAASLDSATPKLVSSEIIGNVFFAAGNLVYVRDRTIMAQPFDTRRLQTTGPAVPLTQQEVDKFFDFWEFGFSVSQDGKLIFQSAADAPSRLVWYDSSGKELGQFPEVGFDGPQFSPDGRSLAVYSDDEHNGKHFIRVYDLQRGVSIRVTESGGESDPVWSPDGKTIAYRDASLSIQEVPADASGPSRPIVSGTNAVPCSWSRDGHLMYMLVGGGPFPSLNIYSPADRQSTLFAKFGAEVQSSPDGKWVAYIGMPMREILVQPYPGPGSHIQISNTPGSAQPRWSRDGKRIFFVQPDRKLMVVDFDPAKNVASPPRVFVQTRLIVTMFGWFQYDVAPDGRLLVNSLPADNASPLTLVTNWTSELKKK